VRRLHIAHPGNLSCLIRSGFEDLTFVNNFRLTGQGQGANDLVHEDLHVTFNADGPVTVNHDNFSIDCK
jgi:hypothetical protein